MSYSFKSVQSEMPDNCSYCGKANIKSDDDYACSDPRCVMAIGNNEYKRRKMNFYDSGYEQKLPIFQSRY